MPEIRILIAGAVGLLWTTAAVQAGTSATGCDDLSAIAETPMVDFRSQIQPIFETCTSCHGESGSAGLDLRAGESYDNLVSRVSTTNPDRLRVAPFEPESSALFLAVSCDSPAGPAFRMPGTDFQQRALIRDWIAQGALAEPAGVREPVPVSVNSAWTGGAMIMLLIVLAGLRSRGKHSA